ncbi:hypothetical protein SAMN04488550_4175 [Gordonia malaquae]|uniref:RecT family protein n=1 Tax=Gordonia malaquae NBRC 108250 TaxID=1223542 RepID=M3UNH9_GORML|nr:hypothetical protein [Gordonia malaquae]GAC81670.1 hypothetical protein GM1_041_00410 [Gordonia malaquae NBRC 108250]SEE26580.1 hypothetical protein SAMN04488550_4175 [Gordonia malaquae]
MTSTDLAHIGETSIQQTAANLSYAHQIATALSATAFVPQHFRGKPEDCAAAILYGSTVGMDPMTSLQNLYVISGKPALYSRPMVGIVLSHGHEIWTDEETPEKVVVCGRRKGSSTIERSEWTIERAKKAGYTSNKKYQTDPRSMLYARASGDVARRVAPDALLGMAYNVEELELSDERPAPRPVESELVGAHAAPAAPECPIPADFASKIDSATNVEWLDWARGRLAQHEADWPDETAALLARVSEREQELAAERVDAAPAEAVSEPTVDDAQATIADVLDAEVVAEAVAS